MSYEKYFTIAILRTENESKYFLRRGGAISSILTSDCLFDRSEAWAVSREYSEIYKNGDIILFRSVGEDKGFLGKTPEEILSAKRETLLRFCRKKNKEVKEVQRNEKKKKKTSTKVEQGGVFEFMG